MNSNIKKFVTQLHNLYHQLQYIYNKVLPFVGWPWLAAGVLLLIAAYIWRFTSNTIIVIALLLEIIGAAAHFTKIKNN